MISSMQTGLLVLITIPLIVTAQRIVIEPTPDEQQRLIGEENKRFAISCTVEGNAPKNIDWYKGSSKISADTRQSVYAMSLNGKALLIFNKLQEHDAATYTCKVVDQKDQETERNVPLIVVVPPKWKNSSESVGVDEGEVLTVDCRVTGVDSPTPVISITSPEGNTFPSWYIMAGDNKITIDEATEGDHGRKILCIATQTYAEYDYTATVKKTVTVDVYTKPRFDPLYQSAYGVPGQNASLVCRVTSSNPKANKFSFYRNKQLIKDDENFKVVVDTENQKAILEIKKFDETHVGEYRCDASNGRADSEFTILLSSAAPPAQVKAALELALSNGVKWRLSVPANGPLPVIEYRLQYTRTDQLDDVKKSTPQQELADGYKKVWDTAKKQFVKRADGPVFTISGLRPETSYTFQFQAINAAGWGAIQEIKADTISKAAEMQRDASGSAQQIRSSCGLLSVLFCLLGAKFLL